MRLKARIRNVAPSASGETARVATSVAMPDAENRTANASCSFNSSSFSVHAQSSKTTGRYFIIPLQFINSTGYLIIFLYP